MAVQNGQTANANTFNTRLMSRTVDTSTIGKVDLLNAGSPTVSDAQKHHNAHMSQDKMLVIMNAGGRLTWTGTQITFTQSIKLFSQDLGVVNTIAAANSPISLNDGDSWYVVVSRTVTGTVVPVVAAAPIPATKDVVRLATRIGTQLVLWDNTLMESGAVSGFGAQSFQPVQEAPTGTIDGVNTDFVISSTPKDLASLSLYINGIMQRQGDSGTPLDYYVLLGTTLRLTAAPTADPDDPQLWVTYFKE